MAVPDDIEEIVEEEEEEEGAINGINEPKWKRDEFKNEPEDQIMKKQNLNAVMSEKEATCNMSDELGSLRPIKQSRPEGCETIDAHCKDKKESVKLEDVEFRSPSVPPIAMLKSPFDYLISTLGSAFTNPISRKTPSTMRVDTGSLSAMHSGNIPPALLPQLSNQPAGSLAYASFLFSLFSSLFSQSSGGLCSSTYSTPPTASSGYTISDCLSLPPYALPRCLNFSRKFGCYTENLNMIRFNGTMRSEL
ncbi:unnamed protein product [Protopolystoma xenopodis]|uniref:Uncharacterized protein n=1 Tax=Protopolystoma xenopodis TaxID=117903 RepID=A0A3S5ANT1_9PLAT|nr:unnamed protein product [Protopolystoma xenopodis]